MASYNDGQSMQFGCQTAIPKAFTVGKLFPQGKKGRLKAEAVVTERRMVRATVVNGKTTLKEIVKKVKKKK